MGEADVVIDTTRPDAARVWDCLAGGHMGFAADRRLAAELERLCPQVRDLAADSRAFAVRAVQWAAREQVTQVLDLGCGFPRRPALHDVAPAARVAYVDRDQVVTAHAGALYGTDRGAAVARADLADAGAVLAHPEVVKVIDPAAPVCVLLAMVLHSMPARAASEVVSGYAKRLAPGSVIAVSVPRCADPELLRQVRELCEPVKGAVLHDHERAGVAAWLAGMEVVAPGMVLARAWRPGWPDARLSPGGPVFAIGGAARVP